MQQSARFATFHEFYPFYLTEHTNRVSRRLHVVGTGLALALAVAAALIPAYWLLLLVPLAGYGFAWLGHIGFERNRPATFKYPLFSLLGDFRLFFETVTGQRRW